MLVWVPGPTHGEHTDEPGSDEYPVEQLYRSESWQKLPCGQVVQYSSVSDRMYVPGVHRPWQLPSLSCREPVGHLHSMMVVVPTLVVAGMTLPHS